MDDERLTRLETVVISLAGSVEKLVTLAESGVQTNQRIDQLGMRVGPLIGAKGAMIQRQPPQPNIG